VTGGQDTVINVFSLGSKDTENPGFSLLGHTGNVCALSTTQAGNTIISGSWDWYALVLVEFLLHRRDPLPSRTAKVWKDFRLAFDLTGHQQSVLAVLALEDDTYLTGRLLLSHVQPRTAHAGLIHVQVLRIKPSNSGNSIKMCQR
jgi:phospholipase A-2-activating protein